MRNRMNSVLEWQREVQLMMDQNTLSASDLHLVHINYVHSPTNAVRFCNLFLSSQPLRYVMYNTIPGSRSLESLLSVAYSQGWTGDACIFVLKDDLTAAMHATLEDISYGRILLDEEGCMGARRWHPANVWVMASTPLLLLRAAPVTMRFRYRAWTIEREQLCLARYWNESITSCAA